MCLQVMLESMFGEQSFKVAAPGEPQPEDEICLEIDDVEVRVNSKTRVSLTVLSVFQLPFEKCRLSCDEISS